MESLYFHVYSNFIKSGEGGNWADTSPFQTRESSNLISKIVRASNLNTSQAIAKLIGIIMRWTIFLISSRSNFKYSKQYISCNKYIFFLRVSSWKFNIGLLEIQYISENFGNKKAMCLKRKKKKLIFELQGTLPLYG